MFPRYFRDPGALAEQANLIDSRSATTGGHFAVFSASRMDRFGSGPKAAANITRLEEPKAVVVIGGQQAGLFGGPLYTAYKALTILALARDAERTSGDPSSPSSGSPRRTATSRRSTTRS